MEEQLSCCGDEKNCGGRGAKDWGLRREASSAAGPWLISELLCRFLMRLAPAPVVRSRMNDTESVLQTDIASAMTHER